MGHPLQITGSGKSTGQSKQKAFPHFLLETGYTIIGPIAAGLSPLQDDWLNATNYLQQAPHLDQ
jgi:hypothetical protein